MRVNGTVPCDLSCIYRYTYSYASDFSCDYEYNAVQSNKTHPRQSLFQRENELPRGIQTLHVYMF